jgi:hypothetical protein
MAEPDNFEALLAKKAAISARAEVSAVAAARLAELRSWQARRLARTYADLHADPRYSAAVDFFLTDLYGPHDFSRRDRQLERAWRYFRLALPRAAREALRRAVELDVLSTELDQSMVAALPQGPLTAETYAAAYRAVGRADARARQVDLVIAIGADLDEIVRRAWVRPALHLSRGPARAAGLEMLQDLLERGYAAFAGMPDAQPFLAIIRERETRLMRDLLAGGARAVARVGGTEVANG